jgi:hypothetical protein
MAKLLCTRHDFGFKSRVDNDVADQKSAGKTKYVCKCIHLPTVSSQFSAEFNFDDDSM